MKDRLEKYITGNAKSFSDAEALPNLWDRIETHLDKELPVSKKRSIRPMYVFISGMAASLIIGVLGVIAYQQISGSDNGVTMMSSPTLKEYHQLEKYYIQEVNTRMDNLEALTVDRTIENDLLQLDAIYQELKAELMASGNMNNHEIIEALIKNYTTKIELLEYIQKKYAKSKMNDEETTKI